MNSVEETTAWGKLGESFRKIQDYIFWNSPSSSSSTTAEDVPEDQVRVINDNVYELYAPKNDDIEVEIIFVHGLQLKPTNHPQITTWLTRSEPVELWPRTWLGESYFPQARILSVFYGTLDLHSEAENLVSTLIKNAKVGQRWGCPVVMVGHCLGGLLIKKLCVFLSNSSRYDQYAENFVENVRGVFFMATPHQGFYVNGIATLKPNPLWKESEILDEDMARLNGDFERLRTQNKWRIGAIGESNQKRTKISGNPMSFHHGLMVSEASARHCTDMFYTAHADHFDICRPASKNDSTFQTLVDFVQHRIEEEASMKQEPLTMPKHGGESLEVRAKEVERRLQEEKRLAIVGMGGMGKTSLAKVVYNAMSHKFEYTCFVENLKDKLKSELGRGITTDGLIMETLQRRGKKIEPLESRSFKSIVQGKLLLLVLDDVDSIEQMDVIPEPHLLANQSRVIVTSRIRGNWIFPKEFSLYDAQLLNNMEAHKLFCNYAPQFGEMPEELVKKVVDKCAGLPLIIQVIGSYLRSERNKHVWEEALERLGRAESLNGSINDKLWGKLKLSYDALAPMDQALFLDCACFFGGYNHDLFLIKAPWSQLAWKNLLDRCLVTEISDAYFGGPFPGQRRVGMHEQLRDMGRSLATNTRIWQSQEQTLQLLENNDQDQPLNLIEGLRTFKTAIEQDRKLTKTKVHCSTLANMRKLRFLHLVEVDVHGNGSAFPKNLAHLRLGDSMRLVPNVFSICCYPQRSWLLHNNDLSNLENLVALSISNVSIGVELPKKFGKLRNLKALILVTPELISLPDSFCELSSLETLYIGSTKLKLLPPLFGKLKSLQRLVLLRCDSLTMLPSSFGLLQSLRELVVFCPNLLTLPTSLVNLHWSTKIQLGSILKFKGEVTLNINDVVDSLSEQLRKVGWIRDVNRNLQSWRVGPSYSVDLHDFVRHVEKMQNTNPFPQVHVEMTNVDLHQHYYDIFL